jgi:hypothetical protein
MTFPIFGNAIKGRGKYGLIIRALLGILWVNDYSGILTKI